MMKMQTRVGRWNYKKHEYDDYVVPDGASLYETDMNKEIICANCGGKVKYGDTYTSLIIQTRYTGMGFAVCPECHKTEIARERGEREPDGTDE